MVPGRLAGAARPGLLHSADEDLRYFARQGVRLLVTLTEDPLAEPLSAHGLDGIHFPIDDMSTPIPRRALGLCRAVRERMDRGEAVVLHCKAGLGRTGTMLAATLIAGGASAGEAIQQVRRACSAYIQTSSQETFLTYFAQLVAAESSGAETGADEPAP